MKNIVDDLNFFTLVIMQAGAYILSSYYLIKEFLNKFCYQYAKLFWFSGKQAKWKYSFVFATFKVFVGIL